MGNGGKIAGTVLIVVGLVLLLGQLGLPGLGVAWPLFLLLPGIAFLVRWWRTREDSGLVFSGTFLVLLGLFFQFIEFDWIGPGKNWPFILLSLGVAFLALARVDADRRDAVVPGWILVGLALVFYLFSSGLLWAILRFILRFLELVVKVLLPLGLIGLGAWMLFVRKEPGTEPRPFPEKIDPVGGPGESEAETEPVEEDAADTETDDEEGATADAPREAIEDAEYEEEEPESVSEADTEPDVQPDTGPDTEPDTEADTEPDEPDTEPDEPEKPRD